MKWIIFSFFLFGLNYIEAQSHYTYISDRKFKDPSELIGYDFRPYYMEIRDVKEGEIDAGSFTFGITNNNLYVEGDAIRGVYNLNNINPTDYGYMLNLMNARDALLQGHLKIVLTKQGYAEAILFRRSKKDKEMIFYQKPIPKEIAQKEKDYFTDRWETIISHKDSIWGTEIYPFFRVHLDGNIQERLQIEDDTRIVFVEKVTVTEKTKKKKKKKKEKEKEIAVEDENMVVSGDILQASLSEMPVDSLEKKIKIEKEYFLEVKSLLHYNDGSQEFKEWSYPIKKIIEREDENATGKNEHRYQLEIIVDKGESLFLYLTPDRAVNTFEIRGQVYQVRGF